MRGQGDVRGDPIAPSRIDTRTYLAILWVDVPDMSSPPLHVVVLMPVRDDWVSAAELIRSLDRAVSAGESNVRLDVLMVDDGSVESWLSMQFDSLFRAVRTVQVLRLQRNLGHQRAIAVGLVHIEDNMACDAVIVMDADGEDTPAGVLQLIRAFLRGGGKDTGIRGARAPRRIGFVSGVLSGLQECAPRIDWY